MDDHISSKSKAQPKNFKKNSKKHRKFQKPQNPRSKMHEFVKSEKTWTLTKCFDLDLWRKWCGWGDLWVRKSFWVERESFLSREKWKNENQITPQAYIEKHGLMDRGAIDICRALNLDRSESIKVMSRIYWWEKYLDASRSCRESIG